MRVMTRSRPRSPASMLVLGSMSPLLLLQLAQVILQAIETLFPKTPIVLEPFGGVLQRTGFEATGPPLRFAAARNKTGALEYLEMFGDRGKAHLERLGQLGHGNLARNETRKDRASRGIGEGREGGAEVVGRHEV